MLQVNGWTAAAYAVNNVAEYLLLGPFAAGSVIDRLEWVLVGQKAVAAPVVDFGAVVTGSAAGSADAWATGAPVVQRGQREIGGVRVATVRFDAFGVVRVSMAVGVRVSAGGLYVVCAVVTNDPDEEVDVVVSAFVRESWHGRDGGPSAGGPGGPG